MFIFWWSNSKAQFVASNRRILKSSPSNRFSEFLIEQTHTWFFSNIELTWKFSSVGNGSQTSNFVLKLQIAFLSFLAKWQVTVQKLSQIISLIFSFHSVQPNVFLKIRVYSPAQYLQVLWHYLASIEPILDKCVHL